MPLKWGKSIIYLKFNLENLFMQMSVATCLLERRLVYQRSQVENKRGFGATK